MGLIHAFVSGKPPAPDPTIVDGPKWNDTHRFTGANLGALLYRDAADLIQGLGSATGVLRCAAPGAVPFWDPTIDTTELGYLDGVTPGVVTALKAVVVDANKDIASFRDVTTRVLNAQYGGVTMLLGGDSGAITLTDATQKFVRIGARHYLNAEEPLAIIVADSNASNSGLSFGGGSGSFNAATQLDFYTAANSITTVGTHRWRINNSGHLLTGTDAVNDIGASVSVRPRNVYIAGTLNVQNGQNVTAVFGADTNSTLVNATQKVSRVGGAHYLAGEEPMGVFTTDSQAAQTLLRIGGGSALLNTCTDLMFYTAANTTTVTGTERWRINSAGDFIVPTDGSVNIGADRQTRPRAIFVSQSLNVQSGTTGILVGADGNLSTINDAVIKVGRIGTPHYLIGEEPAALAFVQSNSTDNLLIIGGGTSTFNAATSITFYTAANNITPTGTSRWSIQNNGHFMASADNTYDIGVSGANRPRAIYLAGSTSVIADGTISAGIASAFTWSSRSRMYSNADGVVLITNQAVTDFGRLQFGGTTNLFPALKRAGTTIEVRLADDSAQAHIRANTYTMNFGSVLRDALDGAIRISDSGGTQALLAFGTAGASSPALKKSGVTLEARLADDSVLTGFRAGLLTAQSGAGYCLTLGADTNAFTLTDSIQKIGRVGSPHYLTAEETCTVFSASNTSVDNLLQFGGGTGAGNAATAVQFFTALNNITLSGTLRWQVNNSGHFAAGADNAYDIGIAGNRGRNLLLGGYAAIPSGIFLGSAGGGRLTSPSDGVINIANNAGTDFTRLQFGGTTNSFPALRRSGAELQVRYADDSNYTDIRAMVMFAQQSVQIGGANAATAGEIRVLHGASFTGRDFANTANVTLLNWGGIATDYFRVGSPAATVAISSNLAAPATPLSGLWWVECTGVSPARVCALKVCDAGTVRTIASFTY